MIQIDDEIQLWWFCHNIPPPSTIRFNATVLCITPLEVWPESHWPGFVLRQADVFQSYTA